MGEHLEEDDEEYVASEEDDEEEEEGHEIGKTRRGKARKKTQKPGDSRKKKGKINSNKSKGVGSDIVTSFRNRPLMTWIYEETQDNHSYYQMLKEMKEAGENRQGAK